MFQHQQLKSKMGVRAALGIIFISSFGSILGQELQITLTCPDGWMLIGTSCYRLFSSDQNRIWKSAEGVCINLGSHLASIRDIYENNEIGRFANDRSVTEYWIGLSTELAVIANDAYWSNGKNWSLLQGFWADEQPDTSRGKCVYVQKQSMDYIYDRVYAWNVGDCFVKRSFICQRMASPTGSYNCMNGGYVASRWVCDGEGDCNDLSDEISCPNSCQYLLKASQGTIRSDGYPNNYTSSRFCSWTIEGPLGTNIFLDFKNFQTEARYDIVKIFVGGRTESTSEEVAALSGSVDISKAKYLSPNNYMIIQFSTDSAFARQGFQADYSSISDSAPLVSESIVAELALLLQPFTYSVSGENVYLGTRDYIWKLTAESPRAIITVKIMTLDLKGSDVIFFYNGDTSSAPMLAMVCESCQNPGFVFSTSDKLYIIMRSGMGSKGSGFIFSAMQGCNVNMTANYGMFFSPGYGMVNYANGQTCTWTIQTSPELPILVYFEDGVEIEDDRDILQVFTNATNEASGVAEHGSNTGFRTSELQHRKFVASNGKVLVKFITSPITNKKGFRAYYSQDCRDPQFSNGTLVTPAVSNYPPGSTRRYTDVVDVKCTPGYRFYQESLPDQTTVRLECLYKGIFNQHQIPNCRPYYCGEPPAVKFGYIVGIDGVTFRSKANYSCYPGYSFQNESQITCQDGGWETAPICVAAKCTVRPLNIANGNGTLRQGDGTSVGTIIDYECNAGYQVQGPPILFCGSNGNWSSDTPTCVKLHCPLPWVKNGNFTVTSHPLLGDTRTLQCDSGYRPNITTFICQGNQTLNAVPVCQNIDECREGTHGCRLPATCHDTDGSYYCICPKGYYLGTDGKTCVDIKECDVKNGYCDQVCNEQPGSYFCTCPRDGYTRFSGDGTSNYTIPPSEDGTLNTDTFYIDHTCVRVSCPNPPEIANGTLLTNRQFYRYGDVIEYQCKLGYLPRRTPLRCEKTGQWSASPPMCQRTTCPTDNPGTLTNPAVYTPGPYDYGNLLTLQCNVPGRGMFNKTRQCLYNRDADNYMLYGNQYECGVINCGVPEALAGSNFSAPQSTTYNSSFLFACSNLYTQQGNSSAGDSKVRCGNDSYWDFGSLQCVGASCPDPGYPPGGRQVATSYAQNSIITFTCDHPGFSLSRSTGIVCILNATGNGLIWNDTVPQCVDTEKPVFTNCMNPVNLIAKYQPVQPFLPMTLRVTDNSGGLKTQTIFPQNANNTLFMTTQNITVTYSAEDFFSNTATCQLQYMPIDETPPQINCINQDVVTLYLPGDNYTYTVKVGNDVKATDDRDTNPTITIFPSQALTGDSRDLNRVYTIYGTAQDSAGNNDTCGYQVIVQAAPCSPLSLPTPLYGEKNCSSLVNGSYRCDLSCNPGYVFYAHQANAIWTLTCTSFQAWPEIIPACIEDTVPPVLTCPQSRSEYLEDENSVITIMPNEEDFMFTDNSGQVTLSIPTSRFNITAYNLRQTFSVSARAMDEKGNTVACSYQILAEAATCSPLSLPAPLHGKKNCSAIDNGYVCDLSCDAGYEFHERSELVVRSNCTTGNPWSIELPACTSNVNKQSATYSQVFEYQYKNSAGYFLADSSCADIYRNGFNTKGLLQASIFRLASSCQTDYNESLRVDMPFNELQLRINQGNSTVPVQFTVSVNFTVEIYSVSSTVPSGAFDGCKSYVQSTMQRQNILNITTFTSDVSQCPDLVANFVTYNVTQHFSDLLCPLETVQSKIDPNNCLYCPEGYRKTGVRSCEKCGLGEYQDVINNSTCRVCPNFKTTSRRGTVNINQCYGDCNGGLTSPSGYAPCSECPRNTYYVNRTHCEPCLSGTFTFQSGALGSSFCYPQSNFQLRCPMGTYQSNPGICSLCPRGTYQNNEGSTSCISCNAMFSTYAVGSTSSAACVAMCDQGFISDNGMPPCRQCPRNSYWINSTYCSPCPNGGITLSTGTTSSQLCLSRCSAGYFSYNGYGNSVSCRTCPLHHYQPNQGQIFCIECGYGQYTDGIGKTNVTDCKDAAINLCNNVCRNGGNCTIRIHDYYCECPKGYYGRNCEMEVNHCLSQPCYNGGICSSAPVGYSCTCLNGTSGNRCQNIDDRCSQGIRCFNGGYCVNDFNVPRGYRCICLSGFGGANCTQQQSVCMQQPCQNGGQCVDVSFGLNLRRKCICQSGYTGKNCETNINDCESNPCLNGATCVDHVSGYHCICRSSLYNGTNCETRRSPCQNVNCGSGSCVDDHYTDTFRCICNPGFSFGTTCDYKVYIRMIVPDISSLAATPSSNATSCRGECDKQLACKGFSLKDDICTMFYSYYTEGSLQSNSSYNTYLKSCFKPTDDYFTPWYDVDDPGADFSDVETLSVLRNVYGLTMCGGTDPVNTECRDKSNNVPYPGCSASGVNCIGNSTNPCGDYEVRFQCAAHRVFSENLCLAKDYCEDGNPCMNGGTCVDQPIGYSCNCPVGYTGLNCQTNINDCTNTSCLNGGLCIDGVNTFTCNCTSAYQGFNCQSLINYCTNNSRCNSTGTRNCVPVENGHKCECYPGYEGQYCEINIDECAIQPCYHGSTCKDGVNSYICNCTDGWTGLNCNLLKKPCDPQSQSPCVGQAMCRNIFDDFYCECLASTYGKMCENAPNPCRDYNKCQNSATCNVPFGNMTCTCPDIRFMGDGCHVMTDLCGKTNYCQNGATCYNTETGYGCTCPKGYVGTNCERNFDDCASGPCPLTATCIDVVGQFYCRCPLGKMGEQCSRTLDLNYDLYFYMPSEDGLATIPYPINAGNTTGMAVSLWVRYAIPGDDGPFFGFWSGETTMSTVPVFGLNDYGLLLLRDNRTIYQSIPFKFNLKLNDGNWHNLVINYDSVRREYSLIADTIKHGSYQFIGLQAPKLGSGMWITLGCYGNLQTMKCHDKTGFRGYISQVNVYNRPLDFVSEITQLINNPKHVFTSGSILQWNEYSLIHGVRQVVPSAALLASCQDPLSTSCTTRADREAPIIQNCPQDIIVYSDNRLKTISWTEPTITGAKTTEISHRSGGTYTWGVYNVTYVAKDDNGNAAMCTFKIYVQALQGGLDNPDLGYQNCSISGNFLACSISCKNSSQYTIDRYTPIYFSRGPSGSFNVDDKLFHKARYPPCGAKTSIAKARIYVRLVYKIATTYCPGVKEALKDRLYGALSGPQGPNSIMNKKLCKLANCTDVIIVMTCGSGSGRRKRQTTQVNTLVELTFSESDVNTTDGSLTVEEVLRNQILGTELFNFNDTIPNGNMDNNGFNIIIVSVCPQGQAEINGACVLCGTGTYFKYYTSENISGYCENCPLGQYQNQSGQSTCLSCSVPGSTTQTTGSSSASDCHASCSAGYYFEISMNSCRPCPIGRYQDKTGQFYCEWCPVGYTTYGTNSTSQNDCYETCKSGQELNALGLCVPCEIGYYRNDVESSTCQPCLSGYITNSTGATALSECNIVSCLAGTRRNVTTNNCTLCEKGTYQPNKWQTECVSCGPTQNWTTDSTGSENIDRCRFYCPSGYEVSPGTECKICPVGTYKDNTVNMHGACLDCPVDKTTPTNGSTSVSNCSIYQCPAGYKNNATKTGCIKCPLGTYQPLANQLDCIPCNASLSTRQEGSNSSSACETYCASGQEKVDGTCKQCEIGYYKDNNESLFGTCQRCPNNYVTPLSNRTARALCNIRNCSAGTKRNANDTACDDCPLNMFQPEPYQTTCISCSTNTGTRQTRSTNMSQCESGCLVGQWFVLPSICQSCQRGTYQNYSNEFDCKFCPTDRPYTVSEGVVSEQECIRVYIASSSNAFDKGTQGNLNCIFVGEGVSNLVWYYEGYKIYQVKDSRIQLEETWNASTRSVSSILNFQPVQESDDGLYECVGNTTAGKTIPGGGVRLTVKVIPKIRIFPVTQTVEMGSNASLNCSLENNATLVSYDWYQDGKRINTESKYTESSLDPHGSSSRLDIINVTRSATYLCRVNNYAGVMNASANIDIRTKHYCENDTDLNGTTWGVTNGGATSRQSCPPGSTGEATRSCTANGTWEGAYYGQCVNNILIHLIDETKKLRDGIFVTNISTILEMAKTTTVTILGATELDTVVSLLNHITDIKDSVTDFKDSANDTQNFLETASNIVDENTRTSWQTLQTKKERGAEVVLNSIDTFFKGISSCSVQKNESRLETKNIDVKIGCQLPADFQARGNIYSHKDFRDALNLPVQEGNNYTYTAVLYKNLSGMLQKKILLDGTIVNGSFDIGPVVMSLQLDPQQKQLITPLELMFQFFNTQYTNPICSYWNLNATGYGEGAWSSDGCSIKAKTASGFVCECGHLTNFAILMTPSEILDPKHDTQLSIISVVGCAISLTSLLLTIVGHIQVWKYVRSKRTYILINICVALLISYGIFLAGVNRTENKETEQPNVHCKMHGCDADAHASKHKAVTVKAIVCTVIAACLHYFYLAVFFIMLVEGIEIAVSALYVFPTRSRRKWLLPLAWIIPGGIVGASLGISRLDGYGNKKFCWLSVQHGLIWAFVGPAALIIAINVIIIVIVIRKMFTMSALMKKKRKEKIRTSLRSLGVLMPITGVTWVLGIFSVNEDMVAFQYLFTIFNSLQGLFIFIFHCLLNKQIHDAMKVKNRRKKSTDMSTSTLRTTSRDNPNLEKDQYAKKTGESHENRGVKKDKSDEPSEVSRVDYGEMTFYRIPIYDNHPRSSGRQPTRPYPGYAYPAIDFNTYHQQSAVHARNPIYGNDDPRIGRQPAWSFPRYAYPLMYYNPYNQESDVYVQNPIYDNGSPSIPVGRHPAQPYPGYVYPAIDFNPYYQQSAVDAHNPIYGNGDPCIGLQPAWPFPRYAYPLMYYNPYNQESDGYVRNPIYDNDSLSIPVGRHTAQPYPGYAYSSIYYDPYPQESDVYVSPYQERACVQ